MITDTPSASGRLLAIASGKGGVGKTWLAITLAHAFALAGQRVLLFDGDLGLANVDIQLGLMPERDLESVLAGRIALKACCTRFTAGGFDIIAGHSGSGALAALDPLALERVLRDLRRLAAHYDRVVLDLGAGLEHPVRRMAAVADTLLVIATEEPTSLTDAYAVLKLHRQQVPGSDARIVVNQANSVQAGERVHATLARACSSFLGHSPPLAGVIRRDDRVRDAIRRQAPLLVRHPGSQAASDVEAIAIRLASPQ